MRKILLFQFLLFLSSTMYPQWSRTSGPEGVSISTLVNIEGTIYAGTMVDGLYYSTDDGLNWMPLNTGIETFEVTSVAAKLGYLFAGTASDGVYRSTDNGQTWMAPVTGGDLSVSSIVVKDSLIFAGTSNDGIFRSSDNGANWTVSLPGQLIAILAMCVSGNTVYATSFGTTYASTDNGASWQTVPQLPGAFIYSFYCSGDTIIAGAVNEIWRSTDQGSTFTQISVPFPFSIVNIYSIAAIESTLYMATSFYGVYKSTDNGSTWMPTNNGMGPKDVRAIVASNASTLIAGTHYVGVFRSNDGGANWNKSMAGFLKGLTIAEMISTGSSIFASTRGDGIYRTVDNGDSWVKLMGTNDTINYATVLGMTEKNGVIYAGTRFHTNSTVYKTPNIGETWIRSDFGLPGNLAIINGMATSGDNILAATDMGLYYSADDGESWQLTNLSAIDIKDVAAGGNNVVYAIDPGVGIYKSTNDGIDWSLSFPSFADFIDLSAVDNYAYVGTFFEGSFYTTNSGNSWASSAGFPATTSIFAIQPVSDGLVLAGTSIESFWIYASFNNGVSFSPYSEELGHRTPVEAFAVTDSFMLAGTVFSGVWRRPRPGIVSVKMPVKVAKEIHLQQNFPNPFNPTTIIQYALPERTRVSIKIYDILGNEVRTLLKGVQSAGEKSVVWDGKDNQSRRVSSGIYFYRLQSDNVVLTRKMMLLR